jgi:hypothetical protein
MGIAQIHAKPFYLCGILPRDGLIEMGDRRRLILGLGSVGLLGGATTVFLDASFTDAL